MHHSALVLATITAALVAGESLAATMKFICSNPRREYLVVFEPGSHQMRINPDAENVGLTVQSVDHEEDGMVVKGYTGGDGPHFQAYLGETPAMVYERPGGDQIDGCRRV